MLNQPLTIRFLKTRNENNFARICVIYGDDIYLIIIRGGSMGKTKDRDILKQATDLGKTQKQNITTLHTFRQQFYEYLKAKNHDQVPSTTVSRPYIEFFTQPR